jgi:hypothetical protein
MIFDLYRIKVLEPRQASLFDETSRSDLLRLVIESKPHDTLRSGHIWMLGNVEKIDSQAYCMRIGRHTKRAMAQYVDGNFIEKESEDNPSTPVFIDTQLEIAAIARNSILSPTTHTIANSLKKLLERSAKTYMQDVDIEVSAVPNPSAFITALREAYSVRKYSFTFTRPNPLPPNMVEQPLHKTLEDMNGEEGEVEVKGKDLDKENLEKVTNVVAANGNNATAFIVPEQDAKGVYVKLSSSLIAISHESMNTLNQKTKLVAKLRHAYGRIRGKITDG